MHQCRCCSKRALNCLAATLLLGSLFLLSENIRHKEKFRTGNLLTTELKSSASLALNRYERVYNGSYRFDTNGFAGRPFSAAAATQQNISDQAVLKGVVFLKQHKCASSSVQNFLLRKALTSNWTLVLPARGHLFNWPKRFRPEFAITGPAPATDPSGPRVLAHHLRYDQDILRQMFPAAANVYVSIVRDPGTLWESVYTFFFVGKRTGAAYAQFARDPRRYLPDLEKHRGMVNFMLFNFGFDGFEAEGAPLEGNYSARLPDVIDSIDRDFDLVMVADLFDESVVLLRHLLGWSLEDVVSLRVNERHRQVRHDLDADLLALARSWNYADNVMYTYFRRKLEFLIESYGRRAMEKDVAALRALRRQLYERCVAKRTTSLETRDKTLPPLVVGYQLKSSVAGDQMCQYLTMTEEDLTYVAKKRQWPQLTFKKPRLHFQHNRISVTKAVLNFNRSDHHF